MTEPHGRPRWLPLLAAGLVLLLAVAVFFGLTHQGTIQSAVQPSSSSGRAPEFTGIVDWENSPPLAMSSLRGKVVLIDFWTYSCINCQRTFPYLRQWYRSYKDQGLVIVGVHSPEFEFEKDIGNVRQATKRYGVEWPVAVDPKMATWNAYGNQYWPAEYLVDKAGNIRHTHFGEGEYAQTEQAIRDLLKEAGHNVGAAGAASIDPGLTGDAQAQTQELYAAAPRGYDIPAAVPNRAVDYRDPGPGAGGHRQDNKIYWNGNWNIGDEFAEHPRDSASGQDYLLVEYRARRVFVVAEGSGGPRRAFLTLDGADLQPADAGPEVKFDGDGHAYIDVDRSDLYTLVARKDFGQHVLRISPVSPGFRLFTFTFGS
ncbi:MAG: thioredoxin family protein [Candidatus Dormibacteraeota bacterium]|nr:thioredoxin family protein [Candidatus Dormibacteraeota bacterium]